MNIGINPRSIQKIIKYVNWHDEELPNFYDDDNDGLIHGVYVYDEDEVIHVEWFKTKQEVDKFMGEV